jgi:NAD-dependent deacetylase
MAEFGRDPEPRGWDRGAQVLCDRLRGAQRVTIVTGAGVSAASGVPTFRGSGGLWREYRAADLATPAAFARDPALVWEWYAWRRETIAACRPNRAHEVIASWTMRNPRCQLITQNVDDLHVRAGTERLVRLHGSIWEQCCWSACPSTSLPAAGRLRWRDERVPLPEPLPRCIRCGGLARPGVVWFGEPLDPRDLAAAQAAAACDVFLTIGTSAVVYPAAGFLDAARRHGAFTAEINLEETPASSNVDLVLRGPAEAVLDAIAGAC